MGGCLGCNAATFAMARATNFFHWYGLESRVVKLDNGATIRCWAPKKTRKNPPLVLLHAFGLYGLSWIFQVPSFSKSFDLYIPDLVFFGDSTTSSAERSEFYQAECVVELLEKFGVNKFDVVGTSYGGFVAYRMAHMFPEAVRRVVLSNSAPNKDPASDRRLVEYCGVRSVADVLMPSNWRDARTAFELCFYKLPRIMPDFVFKDYLEAVYKKNTKEKLELLQGLVLGKADSPELPTLSQDVLIVWGDHDKVFDVEYAYKLRKHLGEQAEVAVIKNTAHAPQFERVSEYNKIVVSYLKRP
ncbi:epoxide hydrolase 3 [Selaginella moellendorffii]|nr:epoxide hydrolase 3 [Selaginella moellendorffii]|eukprot:XP_002989107.2 epoxide hydrolase 3 [Selaginella moellendorffii]